MMAVMHLFIQLEFIMFQAQSYQWEDDDGDGDGDDYHFPFLLPNKTSFSCLLP